MSICITLLDKHIAWVLTSRIKILLFDMFGRNVHEVVPLQERVEVWLVMKRLFVDTMAGLKEENCSYEG